MDNPVFVNVLDSRQNLLHELDGLSFVKPFSLDDVIKELTSFSVLHDEMDVGFGLDDFIELDDVGVAEDFEDADLTGDAFDVGLFDDFLFLQGFDGDFLLGEDVGAEFDFTEGALADGAADTIVAEDNFSLTSGAHVMFEL